MDAATATALVLFCAESSLPKKADELLAKAEELGRSADDCGIPKKDLVAAADKLSRAGEEELLEAVIDLGKAAAALGQQAAILARACDGFGRLVTAIKMVRDSEEEPQPRGFTARIAAWWSRWRKSRGDKKPDLEAHLIDTDITSPRQGAPGCDVPASD